MTHRPRFPAGPAPLSLGKLYLYLPFADDQVAGMQRFGSEMIHALVRARPDCEVVIGMVEGSPGWLSGLTHRVVLKGAFKRLPRPLLPLMRLIWLQFILPLRAGRGATLVGLAHEIAPLPLMRQIAVAHDLTQLGPHASSRSLFERIRQRLWILGLRRSAHVIAISEATMRDLVEECGFPRSAVSVIYEGYEPTIFYPDRQAPPPPRPFLLYAGTLAPHKNLPFLLQVFAAVRQSHDVDLVLVGKQDPADVAALLSAVPEAPRRNIEFRGFVTDDQLARLMQQCSAFVFPSLNEGFGLAVVEAMACGAAVISSPAGSLAEVVGHGGELIDPHDAEGWTAAIGDVLGDEGRRRNLSERAVDRSRHFSWEVAAQAYCAAIAGEVRRGVERQVPGD